jgi:four helix bundle protein
MSESKIANLSFEFALRIIEVYKFLTEQKEYVISKQLLRSACSIGANIEEARAAESRRDFSHKMSIASKEARETRYWLRLLEKSKIVYMDYRELLISVESIINVLTKIVKTTQQSP